MGFMDALKGANFNFGRVDSPDFEACYLTQKGDHFMITGAQDGTYEFYKEDIVCFKPLSTGDNWIKWLMKFKDGKYAVITSDVTPPSQKGSSMAPIERFFGDLLFDESVQNSKENIEVEAKINKEDNALSLTRKQEVVENVDFEVKEKDIEEQDLNSIKTEVDNIVEEKTEVKEKNSKKIYKFFFIFGLIIHIYAMIAALTFFVNLLLSGDPIFLVFSGVLMIISVCGLTTSICEIIIIKNKKN